MRRPNQETDTKVSPSSTGNGSVKTGGEENNLNESTEGKGNADKSKANKSGGQGASTAGIDGPADGAASTGSKSKPKESTVVNRIRGTL